MTRDRVLPLAMLAVACVAFGQMLVIHDGLVVAHPQWSPWSRWVVAAGFELAIVVTGLAAILTRDRGLVAGELLLVTLSVATGWWTILYAAGQPPAWVPAATLGFMPVQYLVATYALHRLWTWREGRRRPSAAKARPAVTSDGQPVAKATGRNVHDPLATYLATVASVGQDDKAVANAMGVSERTARRYRALAPPDSGPPNA